MPRVGPICRWSTRLLVPSVTMVQGAQPAEGRLRARPGANDCLPGIHNMRMVRRMPRVQVYLPDDLHDELKKRGLPASELLQIALRAELERQDALDETARYLEELAAALMIHSNTPPAHVQGRPWWKIKRLAAMVPDPPSHAGSGTDRSIESAERARSRQRRTVAPRSAHEDVGLAHPGVDGAGAMAAARTDDGARRVAARRRGSRCEHSPLSEDVHHRIDRQRERCPPSSRTPPTSMHSWSPSPSQAALSSPATEPTSRRLPLTLIASAWGSSSAAPLRAQPMRSPVSAGPRQGGAWSITVSMR